MNIKKIIASEGLLVLIITFLVNLFFLTGLLLAEQNDVPRFFLDYAVVDHSLKNDRGYSMELLELHKKEPNSAIFLANFWHNKALRECEENIRSAAHLYSQTITLNMTEEEKKKAMEPASKIADQCFYGFYYDNWGEINKSIITKLRAAKIRYKKNNYSWFLSLLIIPLGLLAVLLRKHLKIRMLRRNKWI